MKKKQPIELIFARIDWIGKDPFWVQITETLNHDTYKGLVIDQRSNYYNRIVTFPADSVLRVVSRRMAELAGLGAPYIPASKGCSILDTVVPDMMDSETHLSIRKVQDKVGELAAYVCKKLNYTPSELCDALAAEQIDAVAMAIYNIEERGQGMIIGDQTGIGKGRVAAAMIRYGVLAGKKPVFMSEKPNLFSDIYRDLVDIDSGDLVPFIVNAKESKTDVKDQNGNVVYQALPAFEQESVFKSKKVPSRFDYVLATYSQFRSPDTKPVKPEFLLAIAENNILILDEAHNASGASNTGAYLQEVIDRCRGVTFLSATFAKRPDNMPVYAIKTAMRDTTLNKDELVEAITKGGVALQEIISSQLVGEGQMLRRERSFEGVEVNYIILEEDEQIHRAISDNITDIIRDIIAFQEDYITPDIDAMDRVVAAESKEIKARGGTSKAGIDNAPYFSKVFRIIDQMLFSIKSERVADLAIKRLREGKKPLIAFSSTMGAFLENMQNEYGEGVSDGDTINADFKTVLIKGLDGVMRYTESDHAGNKTYHQKQPEELPEEAKQAYYTIREKIDQVATGITISPIDIIIQKIEQAGFSVAEITGRKLMIQYKEIGGSSTMGVVLARKKINTNDAFRLFNNNQVDVLLINQSGSTGASAHAVPTDLVPPDQVKQRVMIILQAELNINTEIQKRGRINRTGQLMKPVYDYVNSAIPAERRLMMMLQKKLKSLDANTASNQKQSEKVLHVEDFLNRIGDRVMAEYLLENKPVNKLLGDPLGLEGDNKEGNEIPDNLAHKASGRAAVLSAAEQERFYTEILARYSDLVKYLRQTGEYNLEVEAMNLESETQEARQMIMGKGGESVFGTDTILETCTVNVLKKPFTKTELDNLIKESLADTMAEELQDQARGRLKTHTENRLAETIEKLHKKYEHLKSGIVTEKKYVILKSDEDKQDYFKRRSKELDDAREEATELEKEKSQNIFQSLDALFHSFLIGQGYNYPKESYDRGHLNVAAVFLGIDIDPSRVNPFAPSAIKFKFAVADSTKFLSLVLSGEQGNMVRAINGASSGWMFNKEKAQSYVRDWESLTRKSTANRQQRYIITGNILQAYSVETKGKLISFTAKDGSIRKGILLPENWKPGGDSTQRRSQVVVMPIVKAKKIILTKLQKGDQIKTTNKMVIEKKYWGGNEDVFSLIMPRSKAYKPIFADKHVFELCTTPKDGFNMVSNKMTANFEAYRFADVIEVLQNKHNISVTIDADQYEVNTDAQSSKAEAKDAATRRAEKSFWEDKEEFECRRDPQTCKPEQQPQAPPPPVVDMDEKARQIAKAKARLRLLKLKSTRMRQVAGVDTVKSKPYPIKEELIFLGKISDHPHEGEFPEVQLQILRTWKGEKMRKSSEVAAFFREYMGDLIETQEQFVVLYLDHSNTIISIYRISLGGTKGTVVDPKLIVAAALKSQASGVIICHNHPSGNIKPSGNDIIITGQLFKALFFSGIILLDHMVITKDDYTSFADEGLIDEKKQQLVSGITFPINSPGQTATAKPKINTDKTSTKMKITRENIASVIDLIDLANNKQLKEQTDDLSLITEEFKDWGMIDDDPAMEGVDREVFLNLEEHLKGNVLQKVTTRVPPRSSEPPEKIMPAKTGKTKTTAKPKEPAKPKLKTKIKAVKVRRKRISEMGTPVEAVDIQVRVIKRYALLNGRTTDRDKIRAFITTLQRAIRNHQIRKTSEYADEIMHIQKELIKLWEKHQNSSADFRVIFDDTDEKVLEAYRKIGYSERPMKSVQLIKRFLSIQGKTDVKEKANELKQDVNDLLTTITRGKPYHDELKVIQGSLSDYIRAKTKQLEISKQALNGLAGITGLVPETKGIPTPTLTGMGDVIPVGQLHAAEFHPVGYRDKWRMLIGDPVEPFSMMIWSKPGMGKSSLMIEFAQYLASQHNKKVLFVAKEEGLSYTLQDKFIRMGATHANISISPDTMPQDLSHFDYVIVDSINSFYYNSEDMQALKKKFPAVSFIWIIQSTKKGDYRGANDKEHLVDVSIYVNEMGFAKAQKSRYGGIGTIKVFPDSTPEQIYKFTGLLDAEKYQKNHNPSFGVFQGDDGKVWVVDPVKSGELKTQGFQQLH